MIDSVSLVERVENVFEVGWKCQRKENIDIDIMVSGFRNSSYNVLTALTQDEPQTLSLW